MTEPGIEAHPDEAAASPAPPATAPGPGGARLRFLGLAVLAIAAVAAIVVGLGYALDVMLPWGGPLAVSHEQFAALVTRVATLEDRLGAVGQFATAQKTLGQRIDRLEGAEKQAEATSGQSQQLASRLEAVEKQAASLSATDTVAAKMQPELARLANVAADLDRRVAALEQQLKSEPRAADSATPLLLALLQIRAAIAAERPFPAEFAALQALAKDRADLAEAIALLAPAAQNGVPSRNALRRGLADLADKLAAAPPSDHSWQALALARLRGLVTIRRIDAGAVGGGPQAAIAAARRDLDAGDLAGAAAALQPLSGADAAAAQPWLRLAQQRLAVETALARLQQLAISPPHPPS
jgi:hypothetical protein